MTFEPSRMKKIISPQNKTTHMSCDVSSMIASAALSSITPPSHSHANTVVPTGSSFIFSPAANLNVPLATTPFFPSTSITAKKPGQAPPPPPPVKTRTNFTFSTFVSTGAATWSLMLHNTDARRSPEAAELRRVCKRLVRCLSCKHRVNS